MTMCAYVRLCMIMYDYACMVNNSLDIVVIVLVVAIDAVVVAFKFRNLLL